jgi:hypothetical protein
MAFTMISAEKILELVDFPDEIIHKVFACLDIKDRLNCGKVAKRFRKIAHDKFLWQRTDLSRKNISTALIQFLLDRGCKYLDLSNSLIIDISYPTDFIIFNNCAELTELNIKNANICVRETYFLVQNLTSKMKKINLGRLYIEDPDEHIKTLVENCNQLQELRLQYCFPITNRAITSIIEKLKNTLETLELSLKCEKITYSKLLELRVMKKLKILKIGRNKEMRRLKKELQNLKINEDW